jgi:S1-C subfamily serine protease
MFVYSAPEPSKTKFSLGQLCITAAAEATLVPEDVASALARHQTGVVADVDHATVSVTGGQSYDAAVIGRDDVVDLAVLKDIRQCAFF